jgi:hypothetical protein
MQIVLLAMALYLMTVCLVRMVYFTRIECVYTNVTQAIIKILKLEIVPYVMFLARIVWVLLLVNALLVNLPMYFFLNKNLLLIFLWELVKWNALIKLINT